jgi:hypothetical protein
MVAPGPFLVSICVSMGGRQRITYRLGGIAPAGRLEIALNR